MTNREKDLLRRLTREGWSFERIKGYVKCSDSTIRKYIKTFQPAEPDNEVE